MLSLLLLLLLLLCVSVVFCAQPTSPGQSRSFFRAMRGMAADLRMREILVKFYNIKHVKIYFKSIKIYIMAKYFVTTARTRGNSLSKAAY